ncbi:MAG: undecaprenyl/decaprenyl-phosphate alpha-N-acetylglucosaminyl 1-phosphate transferase [Pyrinomonadaceae bacterium MAG19_C2-C3]|nr:undecaprenyl/decaprenyl-phosphate alpha-N-acetylglucosaminyl 1-phosphate transferase [Pyrinomonadaceae bacterium MAG19_C2-C3]
MRTYLVMFLFATISALVLTPLVRRVAVRLNWLDVPNDNRRLHSKALPRIGGVAIYLSVALTLLTLPLLDNFVTNALQEAWSPFVAVLVSATVVFAFGLYDDLVGASPGWKFIAQGVAGALLFGLGGRIEVLNIPFLNPIELTLLGSFLVTVFWVVGISNAFNLIDGMDGLATGAGLFASLVMLVVSLLNGQVIVTVLTVALTGALIGFLRYNFNPASIFLGDSGALFIGFLLAALSIQGTQKASTAVAVAIPLMAFGLPILDTGMSIARRFVSGRPLFEGDREHVHHMLLARGWSQRRVAFVLYGVCAMFGLIALLFTQDMGRTTGFVLLTVGAAVVMTVGKLRYHEVDELKASVKRNITDRRQRAINNIRVRRASVAVQRANNLDELFSAVREMLDESDFESAFMQLIRPDKDSSRGHSPVPERQGDSAHRLPANDIEVAGNLLNWKWHRQPAPDENKDGQSVANHNEVFASEQSSAQSNEQWTLSIPLVTERAEWGYIKLQHHIGSKAISLDINCLCNVFQPALSLAVEAILTESGNRVQTSPAQAFAASATTR